MEWKQESGSEFQDVEVGWIWRKRDASGVTAGKAKSGPGKV